MAADGEEDSSRYHTAKLAAMWPLEKDNSHDASNSAESCKKRVGQGLLEGCAKLAAGGEKVGIRCHTAN